MATQLQNFHRTIEVSKDLWSSFSPDTLSKQVRIEQDAQHCLPGFRICLRKRNLQSIFFHNVYMKYLLFHCLMPFQQTLRKALPVFIPPHQVFMYIDQMPPGLPLWPEYQSQLSQLPLLSFIALRGPIPVHPRQVCAGNPSAPGVSSPVLSRGAGEGSPPLTCSS